MFTKQNEVDHLVPLLQGEIDDVAGGMMKRPWQRPIEVYYDDGVSVWTSDPASTNVRPVIT